MHDTRTTICIHTNDAVVAAQRSNPVYLALLPAAAIAAPLAARADTVTSLLGNFTINENLELQVERDPNIDADGAGG